MNFNADNQWLYYFCSKRYYYKYQWNYATYEIIKESLYCIIDGIITFVWIYNIVTGLNTCFFCQSLYS